MYGMKGGIIPPRPVRLLFPEEEGRSLIPRFLPVIVEACRALPSEGFGFAVIRGTPS